MPPLVGNLQSVNQMPIFQSVALRESAVFLPRLERGTHVCGGEPFFLAQRGTGVPPHAWGWTRQMRCAGSRIVGSPARVEMDR